jgi:excisionase family DNA binding protein
VSLLAALAPAAVKELRALVAEVVREELGSVIPTGFGPAADGSSRALAGDDGAVPLLSVEELAEALGTAPRSIYGLVSEHGLPVYRLGRSLRFDVDAVRGWLDDRRTGYWPRTL